MFNNMNEHNISKECNGGECMVKNVPVKVPPAPIPTLQQLQLEIQKLSTKYNAKTLLEQQSTEALQKVIGMSMSAVSGLEAKVKELEEEIKKLKESK
jgi:hypothetical protein